MREISLEVPNVAWSDVGGLDEIKDRLKESVLWPQDKADELAGMGIRVRHYWLFPTAHPLTRAHPLDFT